MTTAITRLAQQTLSEFAHTQYVDPEFAILYRNSERLAKIVLEMEVALDNYAQDLGPYKPNTAKRALARCQQIASEGK